MASLAIAGSIFQNQAVTDVAAALPAMDRDRLRDAITGTNGDFLETLPASERFAALGGIVKAIGSVYIVVIVAGATVVIIACFLPVSVPRFLLFVCEC